MTSLLCPPLEGVGGGPEVFLPGIHVFIIPGFPPEECGNDMVLDSGFRRNDRVVIIMLAFIVIVTLRQAQGDIARRVVSLSW